MATLGNQVRLTGMVSGLDTDAIVKAMVSGQQLKIDRLNQDKTRAQWKKDIYTDINNQLKAFKDKYGSLLGSSSLISKSSFNNFSVKMAENSALSVNGTLNAKAGSYSVRIDQLATATTMTSSKLTTNNGGYNSSVISSTPVSGLSSLSGGLYTGADSEGNFSFTVNDVDFTFNTGDSLKKIMDTVNSSKAGVVMEYSQITDRLTITNKITGAMTGAFHPGEEPGADATAAEIAEYKAASAAYAADQAKDIRFTDSSGFLEHLGLSSVTKGQNARVSINGGAVQEFEVNNVSLDGMELTFLQKSDTINFSLERDTSPTVEKIKSFVEDYNALVKNLYTLFNEKKNYKYDPLTEDKKSELSEKEIEQWDSMAKTGTLSRDKRLGSMLNELRGMLTKTLGGADTLKSIGITTSQYKTGEPWTLEIDDAALKKALESDPDKVYNIFAASAKTDADGGGLITRLNTVMDNFTAQTKSNEIVYLTESLDGYAKRIKEQEDKMATMSEKYYLQYAKLETAMSKLDSQTSQLTSLFSTGS